MKKLYFFLVAMICAFAANAADYYLRGDMNGWGAEAEYKFVAHNGSELKLENVTIQAGQNFKIAEATWNDNTTCGSGNGVGTNMKANTDYYLSTPGGNCTMDKSYTGTIYFNPSNKKFYFLGEETTQEDTYQLHASWVKEGWGDIDLVETAKNSGVYEAKNVVIKGTGQEFGVYKNRIWYAASTANVSIPGTIELTNSNANNIKAPAGTYDFSLVASTMVLTVTKVEGGDTPTPSTPEFYLIGINGNWDFSDANKMAEADRVYTLDNVELTKETGFKVATKGYGEEWGGASVTISDENLSATLVEVSGYATEAKCTLIGTYNVKFVYATKVVTFTKVGGEQGGETPAEGSVALVGKFNNWNTEANVVAAGDIKDNCATFVVEDWTNGEGKDAGFKVLYNKAWYGYNETLANGAWVKTTTEGKNMLLAPGAEGKTVTFTFAVDNQNISASWEYDYTVNFVCVKAWEEVYAYFLDGEKNNGWPGAKLTQVTNAEEAAAIMAAAGAEGTTSTTWTGGADLDFTPTNVIFNNGKKGSENEKTETLAYKPGDSYTQTDNGTTGIEGVAADNAGAVYYNLQGVRVQNPANGMYIVVRGNNVAKVFVK